MYTVLDFRVLSALAFCCAQIQQYAVVQLNEFICNLVQNKKVCIMLQVASVSNPGHQIGNPVAIDSNGQPLHQPPPPAQQPGDAHPAQQSYCTSAEQYGAPIAQPQGSPLPRYDPPPIGQPAHGVHIPQQQQWQQPAPQQQWQQPPLQVRPPSQPWGDAVPAQPPPAYHYQHGGSVQRDTTGVIMPVSALNPYQNNWKIRARIMEKDMRTYSNAKGDGKLFNLTVSDASGDVRVTGFTETCEEYFDKLIVGRVYLIAGGALKPKNERYNTTSHNFEITLNRGCTIEEADEVGALLVPAPRAGAANRPLFALPIARTDRSIELLAICSLAAATRFRGTASVSRLSRSSRACRTTPRLTYSLLSLSAPKRIPSHLRQARR